jgi:hypothetical protein
MPPKLCLGWHGTELRSSSLSHITIPLSVQHSRVSGPEDWPIRAKSYLDVEIKFRQSFAGISGRGLVSKGGKTELINA